MTGSPPVSEDAEREVLGALLVTSRAMPLCQEVGLCPEHFYFDKHRNLFRAIVHVAQEGAAADQLAAWTAVQKLGLTDQLNQHYVSELAATVKAAANARHHALRLVEQAGKRAKLEGAQKIQQGVLESDEERSGALIQEGLELVAVDYVVDAEPTSKQELAEEYLTWIEDPEEAEVFRLPWEPLNPYVLGGVRRSEVLVLGGWSNMGKSFVLDQMLRAFAQQGARCAIFAPEMSRRERTARYVTAATGVATEKQLLKQVNERELEKIRKALPDLPFDYFECHGWSAEKIAERMVFGNYDVVAVDSVTMIPNWEETKVASRAMRRFAEVARRADLHLVLVSHLNRSRAVDKSGVLPRPVKRDLRDSGMIENFAHQILFLHMDQDEKANVLRTGELYFDKVKNGMKGSVPVELGPTFLQFHVCDPKEEPPSPISVSSGRQEQMATGERPAHDVELFPV